ncbi:hypothetical protein C900_05442 [Fulvivirga imtechensis AK7]|uniref:Uncharacterized protein n=2 Tax=Fulvivirga TaxID=396811 RepID=L8JLC6_9BACT|nr:hypothetical protein C900_05442 [Fulvivirga imtechensis AK7]
MGVTSLCSGEVEEIQGGWWQAVLAAAGAAIYMYNNYDDYVEGFIAAREHYASN